MSTVVQLQPLPQVRCVRVALAGCGTVGGSLIRLLRERAPSIAREHGIRFEVSGVLVRDLRRPRLLESAADVVTNRLDAWLALDADVVIEATGARELAYRLARDTLARGGTFITANKALIATHGAELARLAHDAGGRFHFEAAVGGGVPVIRVLRECLRHSGVRAVRGVLNGTSNYVLTRVQAGEDLDTALHAARMHGFAEADATRDLDGRDAADKLAILGWLAFGADPAAVTVQRTGLLPGLPSYLAAAAVHGGVLRQLAECREVVGGVSAVVEPVIVRATSPFFSVAGEENAVVIETQRNGTQRLSGPGAGGMPTALSLLSDLLAASAEPAPRVSALPVQPDPRAHAWAVSVPGSDLARVLTAGDPFGLEWARREQGRVHARIGAATRAEIAALQRALGADACALRIE